MYSPSLAPFNVNCRPDELNSIMSRTGGIGRNRAIRVYIIIETQVFGLSGVGWLRGWSKTPVHDLAGITRYLGDSVYV